MYNTMPFVLSIQIYAVQKLNGEHKRNTSCTRVNQRNASFKVISLLLSFLSEYR